MNVKVEEMIAKVTWKSEDGFQFMGEAQGHNWDIVSTTPKSVAQMNVGAYVWCQKQINEEWGIHLEEVTNSPFSSEIEWIEQERKYK